MKKKMPFVRPQIWLGKSADEVNAMNQHDFIIANAVASKAREDMKDTIKQGVAEGVSLVLQAMFGKKGGQSDGRS